MPKSGDIYLLSHTCFACLNEGCDPEKVFPLGLVTVFCAIPAIFLFWKLQEKKIQSKNVTQTEVILCLGHIEFKEV